MNKIITKEYLQECFNYDKTTGNLVWKQRPLHHFKNEKSKNMFDVNFAFSIAGSILKAHRSKTEYIAIKINGKSHKAHRLVYIYHFGEIKKEMQVDHIDNNGTNNKIDNLRLVSQSINQRNRLLQNSNKTGINGVNWHKTAKKWQVRIVDLNGKRLDLGRFNNFEVAVKVRKDAEKLYGYLQ